MRAVTILNASAAAGAAASRCDAVARALAGAEIAGDVLTAEPDEVPDRVRQSVQSAVDAVIVGGGDGTISAAAGALLGGNVPLGILPLGTLNHFAKDLRLPLDLDGAARVIAAGHVRRVDVGSVNGHVFINNSSIGIYPQVVRHREAQQHRLGRSKWVAFGVAVLHALRRLPMLDVHCDTGADALRRVTPFLFVGNNCYGASDSKFGGRARIDAGRLCVYVADRTGRLALFRLAVRALLGRLPADRDIASLAPAELIVDTRRRVIDVASDGEVLAMQAPLQYRIHPGALPVIVAAGST